MYALGLTLLPRIAARLRSKDLPRFYRRFIANHSNYLNAVVRESDLRLHRVELSFDEFMDVRRMTIGVHSCVDLLEFFLDIDLPDELFESDAFIRMRNAAANAAGLKNVKYHFYDIALYSLSP